VAKNVGLQNVKKATNTFQKSKENKKTTSF
jgi:hypothetical protein